MKNLKGKTSTLLHRKTDSTILLHLKPIVIRENSNSSKCIFQLMNKVNFNNKNNYSMKKSVNLYHSFRKAHNAKVVNKSGKYFKYYRKSVENCILQYVFQQFSFI